MNFKSLISNLFSLLLLSVIISGCTVKYSLSGASIPAAAQTVSIAYFPNNALMVSPQLSSTLTDALKTRFQRQTRLSLVSEGGDLDFGGEITNYTSTPAAISGDEEAVLNRLTVTVRVRYTSVLEPQYNYEKTFSAFKDYDSNTLLQEVEGTLITQIVEELVEDIFNAAVSNW